ncbi:hypothetical protein [Halobacillus trueperi]|uniref:hypothetical protein n=1 Tax=Halobacillus trueperi TaxID=156205 RepID=UPI0011C07E2C|nr:hypothetical protein [Halobacillus trueperi]
MTWSTLNNGRRTKEGSSEVESAGSFIIGDMIAQLLFFVLLIGVIIGTVSIILSVKRKKSQLDRVEAKVDRILEREKR